MTQNINDWFDANLFTLNLHKTHFIRYWTKNISLKDFDSSHGYIKIAMVDNTKFIGLALDYSLTWRTHIDAIAPRVTSACFALRLLKPPLSRNALRMVYFSYFHSIISYGVIFWRTSRHSSIIFRLQKRAIRIITGIICREQFRMLKILSLQSQYILSLQLFLIDNREHFRVNTEIHHINKRYRLNLHPPMTHLSVYQKGAHYSGIKMFYSLPTHIKELSHNTNHLNVPWRIFCILTHFMLWMNKLNVKIL